MKSLRSKLLLIPAVLLLLSFSSTSQLNNLTISYVFKNADGSVFRIVKYYMADGNKFRTDYISTVESNISVSAEGSADLGKKENSGKNVKTTVRTDIEKSANLEPHTIEILRMDKKLVWLIDPSAKQYSEVALRPDSWDNVLARIFAGDTKDFTKIGKTKILNIDCGIYQSVQKVNDVSWGNKMFVDEHGIILRTELLQNGKLVQISEAVKIDKEKPAGSLFEIPKGFKKNENN